MTYKQWKQQQDGKIWHTHCCNVAYNGGFDKGKESRQAEIQEQKDNIDKALEVLEYPTASWDETVGTAIKILKGMEM